MVALPSLDDACGVHFVYRDLVACGDTWRRLTAEVGTVAPLDNIPRSVETFSAMRSLCSVVLDRVVDQFGLIELTYAFASPRLTRHIASRIHPPVDQHAGHEVNEAGEAICRRFGMAADFLVRGIDSRAVAAWLIEHTGFDRVYYYGPTRPIHVSVGPAQARTIVHMRQGPSGRLVPRIVSRSFFHLGDE